MPPISFYAVIAGALAAGTLHGWLLNHRDHAPRWARRTAAVLVGLATMTAAGVLLANPPAERVNKAALRQLPNDPTPAELAALPPGTRVMVSGTLRDNPTIDVPEWTSNDPMPPFIAYHAYTSQGYNQPEQPLAFNFPELRLWAREGAVTLAPAPETAALGPKDTRAGRARSFDTLNNNLINVAPATVIYGYTNGTDVLVVAEVLADGRLAPVRFVIWSDWHTIPGWDPWHITMSLGLGTVGLLLFVLALIAEFPPPDDDAPTGDAPAAA